MTRAGSSFSGSVWTSSILRNAAWLLTLLACSCTPFVRRGKPLSPDEAARGFAERLKAAQSFAFRLSYHTDIPFPLGAEFSGLRQSSDREEWNGTWTRGSERSKVALRAAGPVQYEYENGKWHRTQRGVETRVLDQLQPVVKGSRLTFMKTEAGRHFYQFTPEVPILDPTQTRKLSGTIEIDIHSGLPRNVYCSDSTRTAEWRLSFSRFNRAGRVRVPFVPVQTITVAPSRRLSRAEFRRAEQVIEARLRTTDPEAEIEPARGGLRLSMSRRLSEREVELLLGQGRVEVRAARVTTEADTAGSVKVGDDAATRVALGRMIAGPGSMTAELVADVPVRPGLAVFPQRPGIISGSTDRDTVLVFVLDGAVLSAARGQADGRIVFYDLGSEDLIVVLAGVVNSGVLPARFRVAGR